MKLITLDLSEDLTEKVRQVQLTGLGREVILEDSHYNWRHGVLLKDTKTWDDEIYTIKQIDYDGDTIQLYYHDLKQMLLIIK